MQVYVTLVCRYELVVHAKDLTVEVIIVVYLMNVNDCLDSDI